jgi:DNA replication protein DnaC
MVRHPTLDTLQTLTLTGRGKALSAQLDLPASTARRVEARLGRLVDRALTEREARRLTTRLRQAKLRQAACGADLDSRHPRGLDKALMTSLGTCQWVREHRHVLMTGPTGVGKPWVAGALGHQACRAGFTVRYLRLPRWCQALPLTKGAGRDLKRMTTLAKTALLILDDGGVAALSEENRRDLWALLDDRHDRRATVVTRQLPVAHWQEALGDPPLADAMLDRLGHNASTLPLTGDARRKRLVTPKAGPPKAYLCPRGEAEASGEVPPPWTPKDGGHAHAATSHGDPPARVGLLHPRPLWRARTSSTHDSSHSEKYAPGGSHKAPTRRTTPTTGHCAIPGR